MSCNVTVGVAMISKTIAKDASARLALSALLMLETQLEAHCGELGTKYLIRCKMRALAVALETQ
jgi:hypothetical protein